jgi:hypothetical protein
MLVFVVLAQGCSGGTRPPPAASPPEAGGWWCDRRGPRDCTRDAQSCAYQAGGHDMMAGLAKQNMPDRRDDPICEYRAVAYCAPEAQKEIAVFFDDGDEAQALCYATRAKCDSLGEDCVPVR